MASEFGIHPLQITQWKKVVLESLPEMFGAQRARTAAEQEELERQLYDRVVRLETELSWLKKKWDLCLEDRREMIEPCGALSIRRQCELLGLHRSGLYFRGDPGECREMELRWRLERIYTAHPEFGVRPMVLALAEQGWAVNPKCVRRILREIGL